MNMLSFLPKTPSEIQDELKRKFRAKREALKVTQTQLSSKSDVRKLGGVKF